MKNQNYHHLNICVLFAFTILLQSCGVWPIDRGLIGTWKSDNHEITVRIRQGNDFQFINGSASTKLTINSDKSVNGFIGSAVIENGKITTLLRDCAISGMTLEVLKNTMAVGKELEFTPGTCGKSGQYVPVSDGGAHLLVKNIIFGGLT